MKKTLCIYVLLLTCLSSCRFDFDVRNDAEPGVYLQAVVENDTLYMRAKYVSPLGVSVDRMPVLDGTPLVYTVKVGDTGAVVQGVYGIDPDNVAEYAPVGDGSRVEVSVRMEGMKRVEASTTTVRSHSLAGLKLHKEHAMPMSLDIFDIELDTRPREGEYVAIMLRRITDTLSLGPDSHREDIFLTPSLAAGTNPNVELCQVDYMMEHHILLTDYPEAYREPREDGRGLKPAKKYTLTIIPAEALRDGKISLPVMKFVMPPKPGTQPRPEPELEVSYEVSIAGVSEDFYRYALARYKSQSDYLAMMGLAPAQFAWSNVIGGYGICGSVNFSQTRIFKEEDILITTSL